MKNNLIKFYSSLIFLYFSDMTLLMAVMWLSFAVTQSALFLSAMLAISSILPYVLKRFKFKFNLLGLTLKQLMLFRIGCYLLLSIITLFFAQSAFALILFALITGLLSLTVLASYETYNTQAVLNQQISANVASRIMQTVIQVGAFLGAMLGSLLLEKMIFSPTVWLISALDIAVCSLLFLTYPKDQVTAQQSTPISPDSQSKLLYLICIMLGVIGLHISTFNLTTPIIFQQIQHWEVSDFGLASGFAGVGAFCAVFFKHPIHRYPLFIFGLILFDSCFTFSQSKLMMMVSCFSLGFCMNSLRIYIREKLIGLAQNDADARYISGLSATFYLLFQSLGTLALGLLLTAIPYQPFSQYLLPLIATLLALLYLLQGRFLRA